MSESALKDRPEFDLDNQGEQKYCSFLRSLPDRQENCIRLFERSSGDFYSVHGEDAYFVAQHVYKTTSVIKYLGGDVTTGVPSCTLSRTTCETFLRDALLNQQMRVEIWAAEPRKQNVWGIIKRASPGNMQDMEDLLFVHTDMAASPIVMAVKAHIGGDHRTVGVCFADATVRELGIAEFIDNDLYSNFESLVIQLGVKECLIQADEGQKDYELAKLRAILQHCDVVITERKKSEFSVKDVEQDFNRLLEEEISIAALPEFELKNAMAASACVIKYLALLTDETNFGQYTLRSHDLSQYMKLDASAVRALNLMPGPQDGANKSMSLYGLLNKCKTAQGGRMLGQWLKQPLLDVATIERRQTMVEAFALDAELRQSLQETHLKMIPDLHRLAKRFQRGVASLQDVVRVYQVVVRLPGLVSALASCETGSLEHKEILESEFTAYFQEYSNNLQRLQDLVETTIDLDAVDRHEYLIKAEFDQSLKALRAKMETVKDNMEKEQMRVSDDLNMEMDKKLKMEDHQVHGWSFRLSRNDSSCLRNKSSYIELATQKNGVLFTTTKMRTASQSFREASQEYEQTQSSLAKEVIGIVSTYCPVLEKLNTLVAQLDVLVSFAHVSVHAPLPFVKPRMSAMGTGDVILKESRHPCLEAQDDVAFIPNDVSLIRGQTEFLIITGPNMGGKSTYIRQIGVIALMAQTGCFVPCSEATLCVFDCILARVGAGDSQMKGVSTFMAEMLETASILKSATKNSLIVIDELGRGTSTYDGFGLAWAISEHLATEIKCFCLFATHFHELTSLGETAPYVGNLHVTAHVGDGTENNGDNKSREITLLYKVVEGVCDQSFGIHVAELAQFPDSVVQLAKRKAMELEDFSTHHSTVTPASSSLSPTAVAVEASLKSGQAAALHKRAKVEDVELALSSYTHLKP
ncbi:DNA mismatch repair protein MSH2 [Lobosporangium transversale]|uniref:DNA mismatch repair protein MSH2 n=1 Tax=Lobosporangium transversale TaxID=64571 RepID=A0A1Y2GU67_9FUNG|nr:DNA mismatch repair protein MSH2 [Lobosporangium transversale]ORZ21889.1 DNA mismatch repair protein MSH2 [Lobosporangium transversale]|eukprot:XP_021883140.1 DNA mismatch repair protein MSH2 [Lobosporangium transversale]